MPSAFEGKFAAWTETVLRAIDQTLAGGGQVDADTLQRLLAKTSACPGKPAAADLIDPAAAPSYLRIPLSAAVPDRYSALLIVWPAGYQTAIHDHDGLWGLELVLDGALEVETFTYASESEGHRLLSHGATILDTDAGTTFADASYAHRCRNLSRDRPALSLHVYGGDLKSYRSFSKDAQGEWQAELHRTQLAPALT